LNNSSNDGVGNGGNSGSATIMHNSDGASTTSNTSLCDMIAALIGKLKNKKSTFHLMKRGSSELDSELIGYIKKINETIGYYWWKQYVYTGFWSYISTPINLSITVFTALTTGELATRDFLSTRAATVLGVIVLCLSMFNTFFRPNEQMNLNKAELKRWTEAGTKFDNIFFDKVSTDPDAISTEKLEKLERLQELFREISQLKKDNDSNFFIDIFFNLSKKFCLNPKKLNWLPEAITPDDDI
jgi:uncharacterized membrane protein